MDRVRFGIIGTGGMGTGHANTMKDIEEAELTAVCDIDKAVCDQVSEESGVPGFAEHEALIDERLSDYEKNPQNVISWDDSKRLMDKHL